MFFHRQSLINEELFFISNTFKELIQYIYSYLNCQHNIAIEYKPRVLEIIRVTPEH